MVIACYCTELCLTLQGDAEVKYLIARLGLKRLTVDVKGYLGTVGIYLYACILFVTINVASAADVNEGILRPPSLVEIVAILLCLTVKCHKALVVHTRLTALITRIGSEVKHIPEMSRPHKRTLLKEFGIHSQPYSE